MPQLFLRALLFAISITGLGRYVKMPVRTDPGKKLQGGLTLFFILGVLLWWLWLTHGATIEERIVPPIILPSPMEVLRAFPRLLAEQSLITSVLPSFNRILNGFALAAIVTLPLGIMMAAYPKVMAFFRPLALIGGYVPIVVFVPLSLTWFGIGETQKVGFLFLGCFVALLPAVIRAIDAVPDEYLTVAATKGATQWQLVSKVLFPVAAPAIWNSLRTAYGIGWSWIILAEIVNADKGIGYIISLSERRGHTASTYAIIIIICAIAVACDRLWQYGGKQLFPYIQAEN